MSEFCEVYAGAELLEAQGVIKVLLKKNRWVGQRVPWRSTTDVSRPPPLDPPATRFIGPPAPGGYRDGNFVFELVATECLVEMQILIREFADIKSEAHESYEVSESVGVVELSALS